MCFILLYWRFFLAAAALYSFRHMLYGFVGMAFFFSTARKITLSNLLLKITFYPTLLPFRKSFYFWTKSVNVTLKNPKDIERAFLLAKKVNVEGLCTDNNKAMFLSYLAALHNDLGNKKKAFDCIQEAKGMPHKKALDETLNRMYDEIANKY